MEACMWENGLFYLLFFSFCKEEHKFVKHRTKVRYYVMHLCLSQWPNPPLPCLSYLLIEDQYCVSFHFVSFVQLCIVIFCSQVCSNHIMTHSLHS